MNALILNPDLSGYGQLLRTATADTRLNTMHTSLFSGLFLQWQHSGFSNPFPVTRKSLMRNSKIASIATYHKCIKELNEYGYLYYQPSYHPTEGSRIFWPAEWRVVA
jgi:hypothetical protein